MKTSIYQHYRRYPDHDDRRRCSKPREECQTNRRDEPRHWLYISRQYCLFILCVFRILTCLYP